jgi:diguanylate cyclase (GGDEF)-like protein
MTLLGSQQHERSGILPPPELLDSISGEYALYADTFFEAVFFDPYKEALDINQYIEMSPQAVVTLTRRMNDDARSSGDDVDNRIDHISACWGLLAQYFIKLASKDGMTGLFNKVAFADAMKDTLKQLEKRRNVKLEKRGTAIIQKSAALIDIDVDRFKPFNDILGHKFGDDALVAVAELLKDFTRASDYSGRLGGDEFSLLLVDVDKKEANSILERLQKEMKSIVLEIHPAKIITLSDEALKKIGRVQQDKWTASDLSEEEYAVLGLNIIKQEENFLVSVDSSFGMAMFDENMSKENIDAEADKSMYEYKNAHRNEFPKYSR